MTRKLINPVQKDIITFVHKAEETGYLYTEIDVDLQPGGGTPPHTHKTYSEIFRVLHGELTIYAGGEKYVLHPGSEIEAKAGIVHRFANESKKAVRFKVLVKPGHTGFENALYILYGLAADGLTNKKGIPKNLRHLAIVNEISEMNLAGPLKIMQPYLRYLARKAQRSGEDRKLIQKYCG
ncbi:cupin domain-containing protein [Nostoc ellipsosporum NOK]|nr:cupin domain-containing protein [Nostoc ellipsosporum NOK]